MSLKKNRSVVSLKKDLSKLSLKAAEPKPTAKKALKSDHPEKVHAEDPAAERKGRRHPAVHFDLEPDSPDADWTEVSNSESPSKTRSGSRASPELGAEEQPTASGPPADQLRAQLARSPSSPETRSLHLQENQSPSRPRTVSAPMQRQQRPGGRPPNDSHAIITTRLLGRHPAHNAPPQVTAVQATFNPHRSGQSSPRSLARSPMPTAPGTPSGPRERLVSRFIIGSQGTPGTNEYGAGSISPPQRPYSGNAKHGGTAADNAEDRDDDKNIRRRKSTGDMLPSKGSPDSDGSSSSLRQHAPQPSRIQQKLWLQRASSAVEPHQLMPADGGIGIGSGAGGGGDHIGGAGFSGGEGRDPRMQKQIDRAEIEYGVLRRFQNPVAESVRRLSKIPKTKAKIVIPRSSTAGSAPSVSGTPGTGSGSISTRTGTPKSSSANIDRRGGHHHDGTTSYGSYGAEGQSSRGGMTSGSGGSGRSARSNRSMRGGSSHQQPPMTEHRTSQGHAQARGQGYGQGQIMSGGMIHGGHLISRGGSGVGEIDEKEKSQQDQYSQYSQSRKDKEHEGGHGAGDAGEDVQQEEDDEEEAELIEQIKRRMWERMEGGGGGD